MKMPLLTSVQAGLRKIAQPLSFTFEVKTNVDELQGNADAA